MVTAFTHLLFAGFTWWWFVPVLAFLLILLWGRQLRRLYRVLITRILRKSEVWLPVVDDTGQVVGKVPQCVSQETPGRYQHPVVRVLVWQEGKLFLKPRSFKASFEKGMVDLPLERVLRFGESIDEALVGLCGGLSVVAAPRFLLKYKHENQEGRWLVLLYLLSLTKGEAVTHLGDGGKLWPLAQIKANSGKAFFSRILEGEIQLFSSLLYGKSWR